MHVADLQALITRDPGRPRVTWYGDDGERVELSGAVLHNWVNKTVNLLVEEFDAAPGVRVLLDLPPHWRSIVWALATWRTGATLVVPAQDRRADAVGPDETEHHDAARPALPSGADTADVVVTARPAAWAGAADQLVAVPLPALARRFDGDLPPGAIDAGAAVMTYGDQIGWVEEIDPSATAVEPDVRHADLATWATPLAPDLVLSGTRLMVRTDRPHAAVLADVLGILAVDGSVVLLDVLASRRDDDDPVTVRLLGTERADGAVPPRDARPPKV